MDADAGIAFPRKNTTFDGFKCHQLKSLLGSQLKMVASSSNK
jgi:hypothetical protein